jgi:hypothetical protein
MYYGLLVPTAKFGQPGEYILRIKMAYSWRRPGRWPQRSSAFCGPEVQDVEDLAPAFWFDGVRK